VQVLFGLFHPTDWFEDLFQWIKKTLGFIKRGVSRVRGHMWWKWREANPRS